MKSIFRALMIACLLASLSACTTVISVVAKRSEKHVSEDKTRFIQPGQTHKSEVEARLGKTSFVQFDSGYEIWVYGFEVPGTPSPSFLQHSKNEYVILFDARGIVTKTRIRLEPPALKKT